MVLVCFREVEKQFPRKMGMGQVMYEIPFDWRDELSWFQVISGLEHQAEVTHPTTRLVGVPLQVTQWVYPRMGDSMGQPHWRCLFFETGTWTSWRLFLLTTLRSRDILGLTESYPLSLDNNWLVVSNICYFPFHIWDVIRNPLTNSIIFQDGYCTTNQVIINHH